MYCRRYLLGNLLCKRVVYTSSVLAANIINFVYFICISHADVVLFVSNIVNTNVGMYCCNVCLCSHVYY